MEPLRSHLLLESQTPAISWQSADSSSSGDAPTSSTAHGTDVAAGVMPSHSEQDLACAARTLSGEATSTSGSASVVSPSGLYAPAGAASSTSRQVLWANLVAGSTAGALAAAVTTPMDVLKTRLQTLDSQPAHSCCTAGKPASPPGSVELLRQIHRTEGLRGLFAGVVPRVARAAPACAVVLSTYELLKSWGGQSSEHI